MLTCICSLKKVSGVDLVFKRCSKENNKYFKSYNPKQESKHAIYLDANNGYGYALSNFLTTGGFKCIHTS